MTALQLNAKLYRAMDENRETESQSRLPFLCVLVLSGRFTMATFFSSFVIAFLMKSGMTRTRCLSYRSHNFLFKQWGTLGGDGIKRSKHANGKVLMARWCSRCLRFEQQTSINNFDFVFRQALELIDDAVNYTAINSWPISRTVSRISVTLASLAFFLPLIYCAIRL